MNKNNRAGWPYAGMTLVEVMVAMSLVAMVMGSAFAALRPAMLASENSRLNVSANEMLLTEMERVRGMDWDDALALEDGASFVTPLADNRLSTVIYVSERESREDQLQVILEVNWTDARGKTQQARMVTFITQYGISA
ncbi:PulJ/GspJ family protein [Cerasicoccus maritimus]|uniref:PulJ/GspJ family protein n=1 Tax=Cerasicoccus maritimus TaxID=490089 RepID=UPI002852C861|nr:prepilin-type N-terminal cleavage/methylation domain-containing protein [Cerasicoccus maritimus]